MRDIVILNTRQIINFLLRYSVTFSRIGRRARTALMRVFLFSPKTLNQILLRSVFYLN